MGRRLSEAQRRLLARLASFRGPVCLEGGEIQTAHSLSRWHGAEAPLVQWDGRHVGRFASLTEAGRHALLRQARKCVQCEGAGVVDVADELEPYIVLVDRDCPSCAGSGLAR